MKLQGLYGITDPVLTPAHSLVKQVEAALVGGARLIQYRAKQAPHHHKLEQAQALRELTARHEAGLIINDDVELCREVKANGVHLGQDDMPLAEARRRLGNDYIIGATCHGSTELARRAMPAGANYLAFGRFFPSQTKPDAPQADLDRLAPFVRACPLPCVAIGGIKLNNAAPLVQSGFAMLAIAQDLFAGPNIAEQCQRYQALFNTGNRSRTPG